MLTNLRDPTADVVGKGHKRASNPNRGSKPGEHRGGRKAGTPNKINKQLKDMILEALHGAGGVSYLQEQARENPGPFLALVGKVLPMTVAGPGGGEMTPKRVIIELQDSTS